MATFEDLVFIPHRFISGGQHARLNFPNKYGISVLCGNPRFYCDENTYEVAILYEDGICCSTSLTDDVLGYQTKEDINNILAELEKYD